MGQTTSIRTFYILILTQTFSYIGSRMTGLAVGIKIFNDTGQVTPLALVGFFGMLPRILATSFAGVLADRWDRRYVMIVADAGEALAAFSERLQTFAGGHNVRREAFAPYVAAVSSFLARY